MLRKGVLSQQNWKCQLHLSAAHLQIQLLFLASVTTFLDSHLHCRVLKLLKSLLPGCCVTDTEGRNQICWELKHKRLMTLLWEMLCKIFLFVDMCRWHVELQDNMWTTYGNLITETLFIFYIENMFQNKVLSLLTLLLWCLMICSGLSETYFPQ